MNRATIFEEHSSVLPHWFAAGASRATVIYLDAHLDLQFVDATRIAKLRDCSSAEQLQQLASPHPLCPDRSACYGIEDFLYPAACLGLIARVIWVAPPHVLRVGMALALSGLQQMEGVTLEALESFHRTPGGWIEGHLWGLDLVICDLRQLPQLTLSAPLLIDIDTDYFVSVPDDTVWAQPSDVVAALQALVGSTAEVTIARSVGTGFLPLRHRFLADQLAALWNGHCDDAAHWQGLLDQELQLQAGQRDVALAGLHAARMRRPACAASCYLLGLASADAGVRAQLLSEAATLDPAYGDDLMRRLGEFRARWKRYDLATVLRLQREVAAWQAPAGRHATAWVALGLLYTDFGLLAEALDCDAQSLRLSVGHPDLALALAKLQIARADFNAASLLLERACQDDETRVAAWLYLAECHGARGAWGEALHFGRLALQAAPAWPLILKQLAVMAEAGGDFSQASSLQLQHATLVHRIHQLLERLG